jgi:hypothetical protein
VSAHKDPAHYDSSSRAETLFLCIDNLTSDLDFETKLHTPERPPSVVLQPANIPKEEIWLAKQESARTLRVYRLDVEHFMATLSIPTSDELRQADHRATIAWEHVMRETERAAPSTIRRRLSALSSLFGHLVRHCHAVRNPVARSRGRPSTATRAPPRPFPRC